MSTFVFPKIILPLAFGAATIFDGTLRTMVVAGKAGETLPTVQPLRPFVGTDGNVAYRAYLLADAATDTTLGIHTKRFVDKQVFHKEITDDARVDFRPSSNG